jgi:hypothetical protein
MVVAVADETLSHMAVAVAAEVLSHTVVVVVAAVDEVRSRTSVAVAGVGAHRTWVADVIAVSYKTDSGQNLGRFVRSEGMLAAGD